MVRRRKQKSYESVFVDENGNIGIEVSLGTDKLTGKRIKKKTRKDQFGNRFASTKQAHDEAVRLKAEYLRVGDYSGYKMRYQDFVSNYYLPYYEGTVEPQTFKIKQNAFKVIIDNYKLFNYKTLRSIDKIDVDKFKQYLLNTCSYSSSYASLVFGVFRKTLDYAVTMDFLEKNVSKQIPSIPKSKSYVKFWTLKELKLVLSMIYTDDFYENMSYVMLCLYFFTGVRVNEGTALLWKDVDFKNKTLDVSHMLVLTSREKFIRQSHTKTEAGSRVISIDDNLISLLKDWRERQTKEANLGRDNDFILTYDGLPIIKSTISRIIKRYAKLAGVHAITAKGLRHSHVSYLINEYNINILKLSKRLGHSSPEITLKHYAHLYKVDDSDVAELISKDVNLSSANKKLINFSGNQTIKSSFVSKVSPDR